MTDSKGYVPDKPVILAEIAGHLDKPDGGR